MDQEVRRPAASSPAESITSYTCRPHPPGLLAAAPGSAPGALAGPPLSAPSTENIGSTDEKKLYATYKALSGVPAAK